MIRLSNKAFLICCIIALDLLLVVDVYQKNRPQVLGESTFKKQKISKTPTPTKKPKFKIRVQMPIITKKPSVTKAPENLQMESVERKTEQTSDLLTQVNSFRASKGLSPLIANSETCFFANMRVQEIQSSFNHDGFTNRVNSKSLPYPSYSEVAENIAMNPNPNDVINGWINSPGHNENMSKNVPYGCVVGANNYYVFEAWKP